MAVRPTRGRIVLNYPAVQKTMVGLGLSTREERGSSCALTPADSPIDGLVVGLNMGSVSREQLALELIRCEDGRQRHNLLPVHTN